MRRPAKRSASRKRSDSVRAAEKAAREAHATAMAAAKEFGRLDKIAREKSRQAEKLRPKSKRRKGRAIVRAGEDHILFAGGRKENSPLENADDPYVAADLMLSRGQMLNEETGFTDFHKRGKKKGEVKFRGWRGGWKARNIKILRPYIGKEITIIIRYDKVVEDRVTAHSVGRTLTYRDYRELVQAYEDLIRGEMVLDSDPAYYVKFVEFRSEYDPKKKRRKAKKKVRRARPKRAKAKRKGKGRSKKKHVTPAAAAKSRRKK